MFKSTSLPVPWRVVKADDKKQARLNCIRDLLANLDYAGKDEALLKADPAIVFPYNDLKTTRDRLAK